eukprot:jgi/Botrbrau1/15523/Bobra.0225s0012.1
MEIGTGLRMCVCTCGRWGREGGVLKEFVKRDNALQMKVGTGLRMCVHARWGVGGEMTFLCGA